MRPDPARSRRERRRTPAPPAGSAALAEELVHALGAPLRDVAPFHQELALEPPDLVLFDRHRDRRQRAAVDAFEEAEPPGGWLPCPMRCNFLVHPMPDHVLHQPALENQAGAEPAMQLLRNVNTHLGVAARPHVPRLALGA